MKTFFQWLSEWFETFRVAPPFSQQRHALLEALNENDPENWVEVENPMLCHEHQEELIWEEGGPTMPTMRGRWYCPSCQERFIDFMDALERQAPTPFPFPSDEHARNLVKEHGVVQNPGGMVGGVNHDFAPGGAEDTPLEEG